MNIKGSAHHLTQLCSHVQHASRNLAKSSTTTAIVSGAQAETLIFIHTDTHMLRKSVKRAIKRSDEKSLF